MAQSRSIPLIINAGTHGPVRVLTPSYPLEEDYLKQAFNDLLLNFENNDTKEIFSKRIFALFKGGNRGEEFKGNTFHRRRVGYRKLYAKSRDEEVLKYVLGVEEELPNWEHLSKNWRPGVSERNEKDFNKEYGEWDKREEIPIVRAIVTYFATIDKNHRIEEELAKELNWVRGFKDYVYENVKKASETMKTREDLVQQPLTEDGGLSELEKRIVDDYNKLIADMTKYYGRDDSYGKEIDKLKPENTKGGVTKTEAFKTDEELKEAFTNAFHFHLAKVLHDKDSAREAFQYLVNTDDTKPSKQINSLLDDFLGSKNDEDKETPKFLKAIAKGTLEIEENVVLNDEVAEFRQRVDGIKNAIDEYCTKIKHLDDVFARGMNTPLAEENYLVSILENFKLYGPDKTKMEPWQAKILAQKLRRYYEIVFTPWKELAASYRIFALLLDKYVGYLEWIGRR